MDKSKKLIIVIILLVVIIGGVSFYAFHQAKENKEMRVSFSVFYTMNDHLTVKSDVCR